MVTCPNLAAVLHGVGDLCAASSAYANTHPTALALVASGQIAAQPLVTHRFPLQDVAEVFATVQKMQSAAVKVLVDIA